MKSETQMSEFWLEANVKPCSPQDMDRVLVEHIGGIISDLRQEDLIQRWHFLRESNWRGQSQTQVDHIRLRLRAPNQTTLDRVKCRLTRKLDDLRSSGKISDFYYGCHGTPNHDYLGEAGSFDEQREQRVNPKGWRVTQEWLQAGSEVALLIIEGRLCRIVLGKRFHFNDQIHFFCNQVGKPEGLCNISGRQYHVTTEGDNV